MAELDDPFAADGQGAGAATAPEPPRAGPPQISLPKGGGAIRGMGEKFSVNPSTGTGSLSVPLPVSPGRDGFGPELAFGYDSGAGNGVFGLGWKLSTGAITRKTDDGLPRYADGGEEADVFVLGGGEDLVPLLDADGWGLAAPALRDGWSVRRYRPRTEGGFARVERWSSAAGDVHWRTISNSGVTSLYGLDAESRVADPADPARVFSWLISEMYEPRGNAMVFRYVAEDSRGVDTAAAHERNRTATGRAANRYLSRVAYGNVAPHVAGEDLRDRTDWLFELALDYGQFDADAPSTADDGDWPVRADPFSSYRSRFEVRTYRLCRRILMFHHFPEEETAGADCLVRSLDLDYDERPTRTVLTSITQRAYRRRDDGTYLAHAYPPLELEYTQAAVQRDVVEVDAENVPEGILDGYAWVDLDADGAPGILAGEGGALLFKRNLSPATASATFAALEALPLQPSQPRDSGQRFLDVDGDATLELAELDAPGSGFWARTDDGWDGFVAFESVPNVDWQDANLRMVDLTGDGRSDVLVTGDDELRWYESLGRRGFGPEHRVAEALDEERGPRVVFADPTQSMFLADVSGDGLTDLVRVRNGEVVYWPNLGYGAFGAKVAFDRAPVLDAEDLFDARRVRLADVDGSGPVDLLYVGADTVSYHANQCGNGFADAVTLAGLPSLSDESSVDVVDLLGSGTACLVWSTSLPAHGGAPLRYVDLMGGTKPHLLVRAVNNFGSETTIEYAPSTRHATLDRLAGRPWLTRLPFPVQVVDRVVTYDAVARTRFTVGYAYHHGYYDGPEREFRGFALVDQTDTEELAVLTDAGDLPVDNADAATYRPPVLTRTWFHTGVFLDGERIARLFEDDYWQEPALGEEALAALRLPDSTLPADVLLADESRVDHALDAGEAREACRALRGSVLRQEIFALDGTDAAARPYNVTERNYAIELLQPRGPNAHAVFYAHARETVGFHHDRALFAVEGSQVADPRTVHDLVLDVDAYGNVRESARIMYGRRHDDPDPDLSDADRALQRQAIVTSSRTRFTNAIDEDDAHRIPVAAEQRSFEVIGLPVGAGALARIDDVRAAIEGAEEVAFEDFTGAGAAGPPPYRRLLESTRTIFRKDDLSAALALGALEPLGLPYEQYRLALTPGLIASVYVRDGEQLIADANDLLGVQGGYVLEDGLWWAPSGRQFLSPGDGDSAAQELAYAAAHFFHPKRFVDPFGSVTAVAHDAYELLAVRTQDALGNVVGTTNDYRVLSPSVVTDANGNRTLALFDVCGLVAATAVQGKEGEAIGDSLDGVAADLDDAAVAAFLADPLADPWSLLGGATTRAVYDLGAYARTSGDAAPQPVASAVIARETHAAELAAHEQTAVQIRLVYADGTGREAQVKTRAEPDGDGNARWCGTGWRIYDNKGDPVREYEPFFSATHGFEFAAASGVSAIRLYDPVGRLVGVVHPEHAWEKLAVGPWARARWDANDTCGLDPAADADIGVLVSRLPAGDHTPTWYDARSGGALGAAAQAAAAKALAHQGTPTRVAVDPAGRVIVSLAWNRTPQDGGPVDEKVATRYGIDVQGHRRTLTDGAGRVAERVDFDLTGARIRTQSMDAGTRWALADATGKLLAAWDSRGHRLRTEYDALRRPANVFLAQGDGAEATVQQLSYGESAPDPEAGNLRGRVLSARDGAGVATTAAYDFKGNALAGSRRLIARYRDLVDWSVAQDLGDTFESSTTYDALDRVVRSTTPDGAVVARRYNEAGLLERLDVTVRGAGAPVPFVANIDYNARGQRTLVAYGNGATTEQTFDPSTFRLSRLVTTRGATTLQDLTYEYDAVGNPTSTADGVQQTIFFDGRMVDPGTAYVYDALYRLVEATGREHLGQAPSDTDADRVGLPQPGDGNAMGRYTESFSYDAVGNILSLAHHGDAPVQPGWQLAYTYAERSLLEPARHGNRVTSTAVGDDPAVPFAYDEHGNTSSLSFLSHVAWDHRDRLQATASQVVADGTPETTYYVYDGDGRRTRKVTDRQAAAGADPSRRKERIYVGDLEVYREYDATGANVVLERQTLHVLDGEARVAIVETRTAGDDPAPAQLVRYQLATRAKSTSLELAADGAIISYEEYYAYGATSYQAVRSQTEAPKRYRYSGRERDEESGLYAFGARCYVPWLGRWLSPDPAGTADGPNLYLYCRASPIRHVDRYGTDGGDEQPSGWNRFLGGLKMVGGGFETVAGIGLVGVGAATSEVGVGIPIAIGGVAVTAHGLDTVQSGFRTMWNGTQVDTFTSQGLQHAGMSRTGANLADAGIGIVGTLGANVATRAPALVEVAADGPSITISHAAGASSVPGMTNPVGQVIGHTRVAVDLGEGSGPVWSHLTVPPAGRVMYPGGGLVQSGDTLVTQGASVAPKFASTVTIPVSAADAAAAQAVVDQAVARGTVPGAYSLFTNDCASYGQSVLNAAGIQAAGRTPATLIVSAALRSPTPVRTLITLPTVMQPVTQAGVVTSLATGVLSPAYTHNAATTTVQPLFSGPASLSTVDYGPGVPDPANFTGYDAWHAAVQGPYSDDYLMDTWASVHGPTSGH